MRLSHGARSLYAALKGRYNNKLQNSVYLAGRDASEELGSFSRRDNVRRWFRELEYYGFIRMVRLPHHGLNGHGKAPHYRLTEEWYNGQAPTRDWVVIIEFPDMDALNAWYNSPEYEPLIALRKSCTSDQDMLFVLDGA